MTENLNRFETPHDVSDLELAFSGNIDDLLPAMSEIPDDFKRHNNKWVKLVSTWFFLGLKNVTWKPKPGIDTESALRHIRACIGSWAPKHEHKEAGCAYLLSLWFDDMTYEPAESIEQFLKQELGT